MKQSMKKIIFLFFIAGIVFGAGIFIYMQKANAQVGGIGVSATVPPNFSISFENNAVVITTNMKVIVNGRTAE